MDNIMEEVAILKNEIEKANKVLTFRGITDSILGKKQDLSAQ